MLTPLLLIAVGCNADAPKTTTKAAPAEAEVESEGPLFELNVDVAQARAGRPSIAKVRIEPRGVYHMNVDFPAALKLDAPVDVDVVAGRQKSGDAERFDDGALVFAVPFTAKTRGEKHFDGTVEFAVCGDLSCNPQKVPVDFTVDVGCDTDALC